MRNDDGYAYEYQEQRPQKRVSAKPAPIREPRGKPDPSGAKRRPEGARADARPRRVAGGPRPADGLRPVKPRKRKRRRASPVLVLAYWLIAVSLAFVASYLLHEYVFDIVRVNGDAMYETMLDGDVALVSKLDYKSAPPGQGDIVAVRVGSGKGVILRRVIATPGQTVEFTGSETLVDGTALYENYVVMANYDRFPAKTLPGGKYYVCGDNRSELSDSRSDEVGLISEQDIVGRVRFLIWPFNHFKSF